MIDTMGIKKEDLKEILARDDDEKQYGGVEGSCSSCGAN